MSTEGARRSSASHSQIKRILLGNVCLLALGMALATVSSPAAAKYRLRHKIDHRIARKIARKEIERVNKEPFGDIPKGPLQVFVSIEQQKLHLYSDGVHVADAPVATGVPGHLTPRGVFSVIQRARHHHSNIYDNAPMPFMQRITWSGVAMHEGEGVGHEASHGCIRMPGDFAARLWRLPTMGMGVIVAQGELRPTPFADPRLFVHKNVAATPIAALRTPIETAQRIPPGSSTDAMNLPLRGLRGLPGASAAPAAAPDPAKPQTPATAAAVPIKIAVTPTDATAKLTLVAVVKAAAPAGATPGKQAESKQAESKTAASPATTAPSASNAAAPGTPRPSPAEPARAVAAGTAGPSAVGPNAQPTAVPAEAAVAAVAAKAAAPAEIDAPISLDDVPLPPVRPARIARGTSGPIAIFISRKLGKIFVRQDFTPLFAAPVKIEDPGEPLGTHVFTALNYLPDHSTLRWDVVSLPAQATKLVEHWKYVREANGRRRRERVQERVDAPTQGPPETPQQALARIQIPPDAIEQISQLIVPGSTLIVSDHGLGPETGDGTNFIVITR